MKAQQVATNQRVSWVTPFPSARLPRDTTRWAIHGWLHTLSQYTSLQEG
jgi:hypothetical protein